MKSLLISALFPAVLVLTTVPVGRALGAEAVTSDDGFAAQVNGVRKDLRTELGRTKAGLKQLPQEARKADEGGTIVFARFMPWNIEMYRDGGTIVIAGNLDRSVSATIRLDRGMASPTRGQFFVTEKLFWRPADPERRLTFAELKGLLQSLRQYLKDNPKLSSLALGYYEQFIQHAEVVLKNGKTA